MSTSLFVASGGTGDLIAAAAIAEARMTRAQAIFATAIWERSSLDPRPGPRDSSTMTGLTVRGEITHITPRAQLIGGYSAAGPISAGLPGPLVLIDLGDGVAGVAGQLQRAVTWYGIDEIVLVDAGGDCLATGHECGLVSPLLDAVFLAAACLLRVRATVSVIGLGVDAELTPDDVASAHRDLPPRVRWMLPRSMAKSVYDRFHTHPSEASLLALLGAAQVIGRVDLVAGRPLVEIGRECGYVHEYDAARVCERNILAAAVASSASFREADALLVAAGGCSEYAREVAAVGTTPRRARRLGGGSVAEGATHVGLRRLAKMCGAHAEPDQRRLDHTAQRVVGPAYRKPLIPVEHVAPVLRAFRADLERATHASDARRA